MFHFYRASVINISRTHLNLSRPQRVVYVSRTQMSRTHGVISICNELNESSQYHELNESSKHHQLNEWSICHERKCHELNPYGDAWMRCGNTSEPSICHELSESSQYHKHKESSKYHELNESSTCHECKRLSSPRTEEIRLKIFGSPDWTVFPSTLLSDRDSHLLPWKLRFWGLPWIFFRTLWGLPWKFVEILTVVIIWSSISSVCGDDSSSWYLDDSLSSWRMSICHERKWVSF